MPGKQGTVITHRPLAASGDAGALPYQSSAWDVIIIKYSKQMDDLCEKRAKASRLVFS